MLVCSRAHARTGLQSKSASLPRPAQHAATLLLFFCVLQAWALALSWVVLLQLPKLYMHNRLLILTVLRLLMAYTASKARTCCLQANVANPQEQEVFPASSMLMQLLLLTKSVHIPMLAVRLPMPILLQLLLTAVQPVLLLWGGIASGGSGGEHCNQPVSVLTSAPFATSTGSCDAIPDRAMPCRAMPCGGVSTTA